MNNDSNKSKILIKYLITAFVAGVVALVLSLILQLNLLFVSEKSVNFEEQNMKQIAQYLTIEELQNALKLDSNNYFAAIKLANLYNNAQDYKTANKYYELALKVSGNSNFSLYNYGLFLAEHNLFTMSANCAERLQGKNKKIYQYKAKIYESIADNLVLRNEPEAANKAYQIVYKYAKVIGNKEYYDNIKQKYASSFVLLADYNISKNRIDYAVSNLKNSIAIKETPLAIYKLGLILKNTDPDLAEKYFAKVVEKNPFIVNPYIYNSLLDNLIAKYKTEMNPNRVDFYVMKKNKLEKVLQKNYVFNNDLFVNNSSIISEEGFFKKNKHKYLIFDLKNNTKSPVYRLFIKTEFFCGKNKFDSTKKVISAKNKLDAYQTQDKISIKLPKEIEKYKDNLPKVVVIRYFARKNRLAPWTLIEIESLNF